MDEIDLTLVRAEMARIEQELAIARHKHLSSRLPTIIGREVTPTADDKFDLTSRKLSKIKIEKRLAKTDIWPELVNSGIDPSYIAHQIRHFILMNSRRKTHLIEIAQARDSAKKTRNRMSYARTREQQLKLCTKVSARFIFASEDRRHELRLTDSTETDTEKTGSWEPLPPSKTNPHYNLLVQSIYRPIATRHKNPVALTASILKLFGLFSQQSKTCKPISNRACQYYKRPRCTCKTILKTCPQKEVFRHTLHVFLTQIK